MKRILIKETVKNINQSVKVCGWVNTRRDHGKIIFIDLRDRSGLLQIVFTPQNDSLYKLSQELRPEWVIEVEGTIKERPDSMKNSNIETGNVEMKAENLKIFSKAKTLPFSIEDEGYDINEEKRLQYRYVDLRRKRLQKNLRIRHKVMQFMRNYFQKEDFVEIETPLLTKSTPEGARDFVIPSRFYPGKFYALPQSPQQYKQLLMVAGFEKYFQFPKCLRDEDPRADRQAEFTQLDLEMSFVEKEDVLSLTEDLFIKICKDLFPERKIKEIPFPMITYREAMEKYKSDRPDLRDKKDDNELAFCFVTDFPMFDWHEGTKDWGAMHHPFTNPQTEDTEEIKKHPEDILADQYDLVLNGCEIGGGSIRTTNLDVLTAIFEVLGHAPKDTRDKFRNYFEAFSYGVPPHGGIAIGFDRFLSIILGEPNIREVMAFPKTGDNRGLMMGLPSEISNDQLKELHIRLEKNKGKTKKTG